MMDTLLAGTEDAPGDHFFQGGVRLTNYCGLGYIEL